MIVSRVQVEEGFLDGLDLHLSPGLNVIIGARGTGKTSVVELIRFALGASAGTADVSRKATDHAKSVLKSGQVTLTLSSGNTLVTASRSSEEAEPRSDGTLPRAIVISQGEIEQIGVLPDGRLRIVDGFVPQRAAQQAQEDKLVSDVRSATVELTNARKEVAAIQERLRALPEVTKALEEAIGQESKLSSTSLAAAEKKLALDRLASQLALEGVRAQYIDRAIENIKYWTDTLFGLVLLAPSLEAWKGVGDDPIAIQRPRLDATEARVSAAADEFENVRKELERLRDGVLNRRLPLEEQSRALRREIEALQEGAGQAARMTGQLRERKAQLEALQNLYGERSERLKALQKRRGHMLDQLEELRERQFQERQAVAAQLNRALGPRVKVAVTHADDAGEYHRTLAEMLRGSGLRYSDLAVQLMRLTPRELLEAVEMGDFDEVADIADISRDRAARLVAHMQESALEKIGGCNLGDSADFFLFDGGDYKKLNDLSTGQRCTVVLPILLEHRDRILVLDQPEDHIDNAFIVDTVIKSLRARSKDGQLIVSTHNANIPVLGDADEVIHLRSDGKRGYVKHVGTLDDKNTIDAITDLMEGGREAFERRAEVYRRC